MKSVLCSSKFRFGLYLIILYSMFLIPLRASGVILFADNFDDGIADSWNEVRGIWSVANQAYIAKTEIIPEGLISMTGDSSWSSYVYTADVKPGLEDGWNDFGIIFYALNNNTFLRFTLGSESTPTARLTYVENYDGDIVTDIDSIVSEPVMIMDKWYHFKLVLQGDNICTYIDGVIVAVTDGVPFSQGYIGLCADSEQVDYRDIQVRTPQVTIPEINIHSISIEHSKDYFNGLQNNFNPWDFGIKLLGEGITSVDVILPDGQNSLALENVNQGEWEIEIQDIDSETEWLEKYIGEFKFYFNGGYDYVSLVHNEALPGGIPNITYPINNQGNVPYDNPVFTWDPVNQYGGELSLQIEDEILDDSLEIQLPSTATSAVITGLMPSRHCWFGIDLWNITGRDVTTFVGDSFWYSSICGYFNEVEFYTKSIAGDFQKDGRVDLFDFSVLYNAWETAPNDPNWNGEVDISIPGDNIINILDLEVMMLNWLKIDGNIFDASSTTITNSLLGLKNVGDSYSMTGYGSLDGAERSYSLIGTENVMGTECLVLRILGYGEIPESNYFDLRIAQDIAGYIRILKVTGFDEGSKVEWQTKSVNYSPIFLLIEDDYEVGDVIPLWNDDYNEIVAFNQTINQMSTGAGPFHGCIQYNWNSPNKEGAIDIDENYICPGYGYVKEIWNDDETGGFERNP